MSASEFIRPSKILWVFPSPSSSQSWIDNVPSKSVRTLARQMHDLLHSANIDSNVSVVTEDSYLEWHEYYAKTMVSQDHEIIAQPDWFARRKDELSIIWILDFVQNGQRVGSSIISSDSDNTFTHHFKASDRLVLPGPDNVSLGGLIELFYLDYCFQQQPGKVTSGLSRNGFGNFNTLGYLAAKLKMGYLPEAVENRPWDNEFLKKSESTPTAWFVRKPEQVLTLWCYPTIESIGSEIITYLNRRQIPYEIAEVENEQ